MEYAFSYLTFGMAALTLLYAALLALSGDPKMIPRHYSAKIKDPKAYARQFAKILLLLTGSFAVSGIVGLWRPWIGGVTLAVTIVLTLFLSTKLIQKVI